MTAAKCFIVTLLLLFVSVPLQTQGPQASESVTRTLLHSYVAGNARAGAVTQQIKFGPLKNGHELSIANVGVPDSATVSISGSGNDFYVVHMGRFVSLKGIFLIDASLICAHSPREACGRMAAYAQRVSQPGSPTDLPFLDEVFPDLRSAGDATRHDGPLYWASLTKGNESLALMLLLHEIAHAALGHTSAPNVSHQAQIWREGEADGFAFYVAALGDQGPMGQSLPLLLDTVKESMGNAIPQNHPPAVCRLAMASKQSYDWVQQHRTVVLGPGNTPSRQQTAKQLLDHWPLELSKSAPETYLGQSCESYVRSFKSGFSKASTLVDSKTDLQSSVPGQR